MQSFVNFPAVPKKHKDSVETYASTASNFYLTSARRWKERFPEMCLISDVAMDPYSRDGHDGLVQGSRILNDESLPILADMAVAQAEAGFDYLGPSDMMDGRIGFLRKQLDKAGHS